MAPGPDRVLRPAGARAPTGRDAEDDLLLERTENATRRRLSGLFGVLRKLRTESRSVDGVAESGEAVQSPREDLARGGEREGVILTERKGVDLLREVRDGSELDLGVDGSTCGRGKRQVTNEPLLIRRSIDEHSPSRPPDPKPQRLTLFERSAVMIPEQDEKEVR